MKVELNPTLTEKLRKYDSQTITPTGMRTAVTRTVAAVKTNLYYTLIVPKEPRIAIARMAMEEEISDAELVRRAVAHAWKDYQKRGSKALRDLRPDKSVRNGKNKPV